MEWHWEVLLPCFLVKISVIYSKLNTCPLSLSSAGAGENNFYSKQN
jgi:hypothetical protein